MNAKVVDSHQHFWDIDRFKYWWLTPDRKILRRNFVAEDLEPLLPQTGVPHRRCASPCLTRGGILVARDRFPESDVIAGVVGE